MTAKTLAEALSLCTPYTPKALALYRQHRQAGQVLPPAPPNTVETKQALQELIMLGDMSRHLHERLAKLSPVPVSIRHDEDMFGC